MSLTTRPPNLSAIQVDLATPAGPATRPLTTLAMTAPAPERIAAWDRLVATTHGADVTQLSGWAAIRAEAGYQPLYLLAYAGSALLGGACVLRRGIGSLGWVGYLPYGPVINDAFPQSRSSTVEVLADQLRRLSDGHRALFVQPPGGGEDLTAALLSRGFRTSQAGIAPAATIQVDLTVSEDELVGRLSRRLRTWTRQWPQRGVRVRLGGEADIAILARLAAHTASYQGFTPFSADYLRTMYERLAAGGHSALLVGELNGTAVAAELLTGCGGVLKSRITGLDRDHPGAAKLNVASAMIWEAIRWGKHAGYQAYDFGGVRPESVQALNATSPAGWSELAGPDRFKTKFGGEVVSYPPAVEHFSSRLLRYGYDCLHRSERGHRLLQTTREHLRGTRRGNR